MDRYWKLEMLALPFWPQLARSFRKLSQFWAFAMKGSLEMIQPAEKEGKMPQRWPRAKFEEPSARTVAENR